ncbi:MAG TPA: response regulator, partial [Gemmatimonadales bacterium]|nr:response regulator [Gemmatimonadales bacterium]
MPRRAFRILIVEDDPVQARLATAVLAGHGFREIQSVATAAEALARAPVSDIVLLDVQLPDGSGLDVLRRLRERSSRPAVVIVTAHGAEHVAIEALRLGADDYVSKDSGFIDLLPGVVERVRRSVGLRDALETAEGEVVAAERRAAVGEMTVALHHEINNPLMAAL